MADKRNSTVIRAGTRTYFLDVRRTKDGTNYLVITESRYKGVGEDHERQSIRIFPEQSSQILEELTTLIWSLK